jgi:hypothetical protein
MPEFARCLWLLSASGAYAAALVVIRGRPSVGGDAGVFVSVAGRLLRGDRLYVNVLDNKDPLFFYSDAAALGVLGWRGPFLLDVVWLTVAATSTVLLLRAIGASRVTAAVGFVAYPLLLTGAWYYSGYSMLAVLAFAPLIGWLWIRDSLALAGALFGVGLLFKVNLALVLASAPLAFLLLRLPAGSVRAQVARAAAGFGVLVAAAAAILALRGELHGYLENLINNVTYSRNVLPATGRLSGIMGHIKVAAGATGKQPWHFAVFAAAFLLTGLLAIRTLRHVELKSGQPVRSSAMHALAALFLCSTVATAVTLALTAAWSEHDQILAYPGLMLIAFLVAMAGGAAATLPRTVAACAAAGLGIALLGGTAASKSSSGGVPISTWTEASRSETADLLERAADDRFPQLHEITFAHLGQNDEQGAAAFLDDRFVLACPAIAQYVFTPDLPGVLRCIQDEKPRLVLVTPSFTSISHAPITWNRFVVGGESLLSNGYQRLLGQQTGRGWTEIWALPAEAGSAGVSRRPASSLSRAFDVSFQGVTTESLFQGMPVAISKE